MRVAFFSKRGTLLWSLRSLLSCVLACKGFEVCMASALRCVLGVVCDPPVVGRLQWPDQIAAVLPKDISLSFVNAFADELLPDVHGAQFGSLVDAVIISGSVFNITDRGDFAWMQKTITWVKDVIRLWPRVPIVGICFGHQLLCEAFGGVVASNPLGWELGSHELFMTNSAAARLFFGEDTTTAKVQETHSQVVSVLPTGASVLAHTVKDPNHVVLYAAQVLGMQYHPEYDTRHMKQMLAKDVDEGSADYNVMEWNEIVESSPAAVHVVECFLKSWWSA